MSIIVTQNGKDAKRIDVQGVPEEAFLQDYILNNPEALPLSDLRDDLKFLVVAREFSTAVGPIDAVGIDDQGEVYLIEAKLYRNSDKRRVLAQVLDYGAALWAEDGESQSFRSRLLEAARRTLSTDPQAKIADAFGIDSDDVAKVLDQMAVNADQGRFRFVVLMDHLDDALKNLIQYINENSRFDVLGVELQFYRFDGYELTLPKMYGAEVRKEAVTQSSGRRIWDEDSYFEEVTRRLPGNQVKSVRRLFEFATGHADRVTWGTGTIAGSFSVKYDHINTRSVMSVYSHGRLELNLKWLHSDGEPLPEPVQRFIDVLAQLEGWDPPPGYADTYPRILIDVWASQVDKVIEALGQVKEVQVKEAQAKETQVKET